MLVTCSIDDILTNSCLAIHLYNGFPASSSMFVLPQAFLNSVVLASLVLF